MSLLRNGILPVALGLMLAPAAWAGDDNKKSEGAKGQEQKVWGVVSEVTVLGETDIDYKTRKAVTAEATFVTIIGHPAHHDAMHKDAATAGNENKDRDVKRTSNDSSANSGERHRHRMNVYVVAVSPKTKVCEVRAMGKDSSASAKEEACELDKLEIGDRVEVCFEPKMDSKSSGDKEEARGALSKHGRHRTYFGTATAIKIMDEPTHFGPSSSSSDKSDKNDKK